MGSSPYRSGPAVSAIFNPTSDFCLTFFCKTLQVVGPPALLPGGIEEALPVAIQLAPFSGNAALEKLRRKVLFSTRKFFVVTLS
jgi:hypothetical protein